MTNDIKILLERVLKSLSFGLIKKNENGKGSQFDYTSLRDLILMTLERAGESKDAIIITLGKEIGLTLASVLKVPLSQLAERKKLRITIELVSKTTKQKTVVAVKEKTDNKKSPPHKKKKATPSAKKSPPKKKK